MLIYLLLQVHVFPRNRPVKVLRSQNVRAIVIKIIKGTTFALALIQGVHVEIPESIEEQESAR